MYIKLNTLCFDTNGTLLLYYIEYHQIFEVKHIVRRGGADEVRITVCSVYNYFLLESCDSSVIVYSSSSRSLTPTHSRVGIVLCVAVVTFDLSGGWDLLISGRDGLVGSGCTLTLVSKGDISRNSPVCGETNKLCT